MYRAVMTSVCHPLTRTRVAALALSIAGATAPLLLAQQNPDPGPRVAASRVLIERGGRLDWSRQGNLIVFDRPGADGLFDLWTHDPDSGGERCLTCETFEFRRASAINPAWSPSGEWIVFQRQDHAKKLDLGAAGLLGPQRGLWTELWLIRADGRSYWQLTRATDVGSAVLDPHVSFEGDRLLWSQRIRSREGAWGAWQLRTAAIELSRGVPRLKKAARHAAAELDGLVIAHGFLPDDRRLLFSAERGGRGGLDIGVLDPATGSVELLTRSQAGVDGYAAISPKAPLIAFASQIARAPGPAAPDGAPDVTLPAGEVWLMGLDGSDKRTLTRFNDSHSPESLGRAWVGDLAWSADGDRLAVQVVSGIAEGRPAIVLLELEGGSGR